MKGSVVPKLSFYPFWSSFIFRIYSPECFLHSVLQFLKFLFLCIVVIVCDSFSREYMLFWMGMYVCMGCFQNRVNDWEMQWLWKHALHKRMCCNVDFSNFLPKCSSRQEVLLSRVEPSEINSARGDYWRLRANPKSKSMWCDYIYLYKYWQFLATQKLYEFWKWFRWDLAKRKLIWFLF